MNLWTFLEKLPPYQNTLIDETKDPKCNNLRPTKQQVYGHIPLCRFLWFSCPCLHRMCQSLGFQQSRSLPPLHLAKDLSKKERKKSSFNCSSETLPIFYLVERVVIIPGHLTWFSSTWLRLRLSFLFNQSFHIFNHDGNFHAMAF